ncbi:MAG: hypothetical protein LBB53_02325 [Prevotellaceae bacterium]|nr:hypothetical protein [Prevotellaceae bacterium]
MVREAYSGNHPKRAKMARKAKKRLKTVANKMLREFDRKMTDEQKNFYKKDLELYQRAVNQQKTHKNRFGGRGNELKISVFFKHLFF